jgi:hypothetical protein
MTSMLSRRRSSAQMGTRTCVAAHARHRARRGRSVRERDARSSRAFAHPHGPSCPPHDGQRRAPERRSFSTWSPSSSTASTVSSMASRSHLLNVAPAVQGREGQLVLRSSPPHQPRASRLHRRVFTHDVAAGGPRPHPAWRSTNVTERHQTDLRIRRLGVRVPPSALIVSAGSKPFPGSIGDVVTR